MAKNLESVLTELQCPACKFLMAAPIRQCETGHSMCSECFDQVRTCPYCRGPKDTVSRNFALEAIHAKLIVPCKNAYVGCQFESLGREIVRHETLCDYNNRTCAFPGCAWNGTVIELKEHLSTLHSMSFHRQTVGEYVPSDNNDPVRYKCNKVVCAFKEYFHLILDLDTVAGKRFYNYLFFKLVFK